MAKAFAAWHKGLLRLQELPYLPTHLHCP